MNKNMLLVASGEQEYYSMDKMKRCVSLGQVCQVKIILFKITP